MNVCVCVCMRVYARTCACTCTVAQLYPDCDSSILQHSLYRCPVRLVRVSWPHQVNPGNQCLIWLTWL